MLGAIIIDPGHDAFGISPLGQMARTIGEHISGGKVALNPSPTNKIAIVALIGSVFSPYFARNSSHP